MNANPALTIGVAVIAAGAALLGALIAALTANHRQSQQLGHDRARADISELRGVLDEAAGRASAAYRSMLDADRYLAKGRPLGDDARRELEARRDDLSGSAQRLRLRLGRSPVHAGFEKLTVAYSGFVAATTKEAHAQELDAYALARDDFLDQAHIVARSKTEEPERWWRRLRAAIRGHLGGPAGGRPAR